MFYLTLSRLDERESAVNEPGQVLMGIARNRVMLTGKFAVGVCPVLNFAMVPINKLIVVADTTSVEYQYRKDDRPITMKHAMKPCTI